MSAARHDIPLPGCTPEPIMAYLKALGILRLVSEQKDEGARGWWKNDVFWLQSRLDKNGLEKFFLMEYKPTPIVVPWSGTDFFAVNPKGNQGPFSKTPTGSAAIAALLATNAARLAPYREAIRICLACLNKLGFTSKKVFEGSQKDKSKTRYLQFLRSTASDVVVDWIDVTTVIGHEKVEFSAMLGSGGGSDGNTHFSDNFMQNLWEMLPDFDPQRKQKNSKHALPASGVSADLLCNALFLSATRRLVEKRTSALYDSGAVGGANATHGLRRASLSNPWNVILLFEGTLSIAGAMSKRSDPDRLSPSVGRRDQPAFPFQFSFTPSLQDRSPTKESTGREIWFPTWSRPATHKEIASLFGEGRAEISRWPVRNGTEMVQAAATLGVDRGVSNFRRYAIVKGRVGGENYNTAASLGVFDFREHENAHLLAQVNQWLNRFRYACAPGRQKDEAPRRLLATLDCIDSAIFEFCKYGGARLFQDIVIVLGRAERELALTQGKFSRKTVNPIPPLSRAWIEAADDRSVEFTVARALASVHDPEERMGPFRSNLEPVDWKKRCRRWAEKDRAVVWNAADLATNLANVLQRRLMDGGRAGCERLPLAFRFAAPLDTVAAFLAGEVDGRRIEDLIWGLMLIEGGGSTSRGHAGADDSPVPRAYALLRLLFLPRPLIIVRGTDGTPFARLLRENERGGVVIRPEPAILHLLRGGRLGEACAIAMRRLRASGLDPMPKRIRGRGVRDREWRELDRMGGAGIDPRRLAAALLIPVSNTAVSRLVRLVIRGDGTGEDRISKPSPQ